MLHFAVHSETPESFFIFVRRRAAFCRVQCTVDVACGRYVASGVHCGEHLSHLFMFHDRGCGRPSDEPLTHTLELYESNQTSGYMLDKISDSPLDAAVQSTASETCWLWVVKHVGLRSRTLANDREVPYKGLGKG